jgi:hypothetical protein
MRESRYDLNHLLFLQQVALMEADAAATDVGRSMHLRIARAYEAEISRRTDGRMRFGRASAKVERPEVSVAAPTLTLVAA